MNVELTLQPVSERSSLVKIITLYVHTVGCFYKSSIDTTVLYCTTFTFDVQFLTVLTLNSTVLTHS